MRDFLRQLKTANSYEQYVQIAQQMDKFSANEEWKSDSKDVLYDYKLIESQLNSLLNHVPRSKFDEFRQNSRSTNIEHCMYVDRRFQKLEEVLDQTHSSVDIKTLLHNIRSCLIRNIGNIGNAKLFSKSYIGTKYLIEAYNEETANALDFIVQNEFNGISLENKDLFLTQTRLAFGNSALVLNGGATIGLMHVGVVKALFEQDLLPRIMCGTAVGAMIAALVSIHTNEELPELFKKGVVDLSSFVSKDKENSFHRKMTRFLKYGYLLDVKVLEDCVHKNVDDYTFEEAFKKTRRILNIAIEPERAGDYPMLLNYITAPNVLIWSAACLSVSSTYPLYNKVDLLAKDSNGRIKKWRPDGFGMTNKKSNGRRSSAFLTSFIPPPQYRNSHTSTTGQSKIQSNASLLPHGRISELFNVNHFIVSEAGFLTVPFMDEMLRDKESFYLKVYKFILMETRYRASQIYFLLRMLAILVMPILNVLLMPYYGILKFLMHDEIDNMTHLDEQDKNENLFVMFSWPVRVVRWLFAETFEGDVVIAPELQFEDYKNVFNNPYPSDLNYWILKGERATWPLLSLIRNRCWIEKSIDKST
eukprot:NODE_495_length_7749_cov_0.107974.p2 type:complete len:587 gc:universal NODE_495_length_7749_cov_0.107974:5412-3652(-)